MQGIPTIARSAGLQLLVLFGSRAQGDAAPGSDFDLAAEAPPGWNHERHLDLLDRLGDCLEQQVDLVLLSASTDPVLLHEIFAPGSRCLYEAEAGLFHAWRSLAARIYAEHLVVVKRHWDELRQATAERRTDVS